MTTPNSPQVKPAEHPSDYIPIIAAERASLLRSEQRKTQRRLFTIGKSGSGKTYSTIVSAARLGWKVYVIDYDNQLVDDEVRASVTGVFPMHSSEFVAKLGAGTDPLKQYEHVILNHCMKLPGSALVFTDSMTMFADLLSDFLTKGKPKSEDGYWYWREWAKAWRRIMTLNKDLPCNAAISAHERTSEPDELAGKAPLKTWILQGREFTPRIPTFFTDVVLQVHECTPLPTDKTRVADTYWWQIKPDAEFPHAKSKRPTNLVRIPADWAELVKTTM